MYHIRNSTRSGHLLSLRYRPGEVRPIAIWFHFEEGANERLELVLRRLTVQINTSIRSHVGLVILRMWQALPMSISYVVWTASRTSHAEISAEKINHDHDQYIPGLTYTSKKQRLRLACQ